MDRREVLSLAGAAALGAVTRTLSAAVSPRSPARLGPLGVQLYTVRTAMQANMDDTLRQVAGIGYREVEFAGYFDVPPRRVREMLDRYHLTAPSGHFPIEALDGDVARAFDAAKTVGHRYFTVAWTPQERRRTLDDWRRIGDLYNRAGEQAQAAGLQFAYHNHSYEFEPLEGRLPYDVLLEATDPGKVKLELDLYWITAGGQDPLAYFTRFPGRFPMVHVKDMAADKHMMDVGAGTIDWRHILGQHRQAGIEHYFVEHDEPAQPFVSIRNSFRYLSRLSV